jgi:predicted metalloprotease with PDZ domain
MISYAVSLETPKEHLIQVTLTIENGLDRGQLFWLPNWIPGSYMIREFSRNITEISAQENGISVELSKVSSNSWELQQSVASLSICYKIYAWDLSVRSAHFDQQHCFFNGTSVFLATKGFENEQHVVEIQASRLAIESDWTVSTSMLQQDCNVTGFGKYTSQNYAELIDHPFEIASTIKAGFRVKNIPHQMVFAEPPEGVDLERIARDVNCICQYECDFFGDEIPPFESYLFMIFVQKNGFGGLEHRASTALHCGHADLPMIEDDPKVKSEGYQTFLGLCSHEYFHSWNVKRIKPARFKPYHLEREVNTELLWFFEGVTSYYDELFLLRCGVISAEEYLNMIAKNITRYMKSEGRNKQSITESSFDAWTKFYKQDENAPNAIVSYYIKGGLVAFCLDFEIRRLTKDAQNLDDLMRMIWNTYGKPLTGVAEKDIQASAEKLVGQPMTGFFQHVLYSTKELDLESLFEQLGIDYRLSSSLNQVEKGGFQKKFIERHSVNSLAITHKGLGAGVEVISVFNGGAGSIAGLSNKDIIIAIDGYRVNSKELDQLIAKYPLNKKIKISFFRRDKLQQVSCQLSEGKKHICHLSFKNENPAKEFLNWANK